MMRNFAKGPILKGKKIWEVPQRIEIFSKQVPVMHSQIYFYAWKNFKN